MRHFIAAAALLCALPLAGAEPAPAGTEPPAGMPAAKTTVEVGDRLPPFSAQDQFDRPATLGGETRLLILAAGMHAGEAASEVLREAGEDCYQSPALFYVADISRMPKGIANRFALPKMREQPVPVALVRDGAVEGIPREVDKLTLLMLDDYVVDRVEMADSEGVRRALAEVCR